MVKRLIGFLLLVLFSFFHWPIMHVEAQGSLNELTSFTGAQTRLVWIQDMSERSMGAVEGTKRLMGVDSGDGRGERAILGTPGNYEKPLMTPRGDRVVFSDRVRKKINIVNFDGSGLRELTTGFGMAVWWEGVSGIEWIYYGMNENKDEHCPVIYRMPLDGGRAAELVWNKTLVSVDGFQVSLDGKRASGNFPWPDGGIATLPNGVFTRLTNGCWPGLAPGDVTLYWIFDGTHRNLTLVNYKNNRRWQVNINGAPGIDGYEVYHPKWGNNSRYMVMTGPYKEGSGSNRIMAGGRGVEIYIGRFNADHTAVESWRQATKNDRGDFFPDIWVAPPAEPAKQSRANIPGAEKIKAEKSAEDIALRSAKTEPMIIAPGKPVPRKTITHLIVEARLTDISGIPPPRISPLINARYW
jgi:hypothetical protein